MSFPQMFSSDNALAPMLQRAIPYFNNAAMDG